MQLSRGRIEASAEDVAHLVGLYDENLASADLHLGDLVAGLRQRGDWDQTVLIVAADHGEAFGEHRKFLHGDQVYQEDVRVPLLVRLPNALGIPPQEIDRPTQLCDVAPSLIEVLGLPETEAMLGTSFAPMLRGEATGERKRPVVSIGFETVSIRRDQLKRMQLLHNGDARYVHLYDLESDPGETHDLSRERPEASEVLARDLAVVMRRMLVNRKRAPKVQLEESRLRNLRALGYVE